MMSWILILSLMSSMGLLAAQIIIYDIDTQVQSMDISIRHPRFYAIYISYKTTFFNFFYCEVISKRILIIFAPEEAEIFKEYLFILAWLRWIAFILAWFKDNFCFLTSNLLYILTKIKSEKSTFVFKSSENKNHADKNYYQIKNTIQRILRVFK